MSSYYSKKTSNISYYSSGSSSVQTEANMRQEMINTLQGAYPEMAKGQTGVLRRMRRDSNGDVIACECIDSVTKEPDKSFFCPFCLSTGHYFDEEYVTFYKVLLDTSFSAVRRHNMLEPGIIDGNFIAFYLMSSVLIKKEDKIIEISLEEDGSPSSPIVYVASYEIDKAWDYRSDNGKIEYWKVFTHREETKYLVPPEFGS